MSRLTLDQYLRQQISYWTESIRLEHGNRCIITGKGFKLSVHHAVSFSETRDLVLEELSLPKRKYTDQYTRKQLHKLSLYFKLAHSDMKGYPIRRSLHRAFHLEYGINANEEQFLAYVSREKAARTEKPKG